MIHIAFGVDDKYIQHLCTTITSILVNNKFSDFTFHILYSSLTDKSKKNLESLKKIKNFNIEYYDIHNFDFSSVPLKINHISVASYYRFALSEVIPDGIEKLMYLDCDIIVDGDISELWNTDIEGYWAAAVEDLFSIELSTNLKLKNYFNSGMLILNMAKLKSVDFKSMWMNYLQENKDIITLQDQDILNGIFDNNVKFLPLKYNAFDWDRARKQKTSFYSLDENTDYSVKPVIYHFAGRRKPWTFDASPESQKIYYKYILKTPYKWQYVKYILATIKSFIFSVQKKKKRFIVTFFGFKIKIKRSQKG